MYIPKYFSLTDHQKIISFLKENNFGLIVSSKSDELAGTHLPFVIKADENNIFLTAHLAKANPQWKTIDETKEVLVIFQGPHAYISTKFYDHNINVPTWNYTAIHIYGFCRIITEENEMLNVLYDSFEAFEPGFKNQWNELPEDYKKGLLNGIVAFEIKASKIQAKFKLSQNRSKQERERIIECFDKSDDYLLTALAREMKKVSGN